MTNKKTLQNKKGQLSALIGNYSFILIFAAIFVGYLIINQGATTWSGVMNILRHSAVVGIIAFGMGLVIITGGIDLSVGSMLALIGGMSVVVIGGLLYATVMTVVIVPVIYDILFKRKPLEVDIGSENLDDVPDDAAEFIAEALATQAEEIQQ